MSSGHSSEAIAPYEQIKFWRDSALRDLEVLRATYVTHTFSRHTHDGYAIGVIDAGVEEFTYRGVLYRAPADSVVIIHPGEVHTGHAGTPSGWTYRMLYPDAELMQNATAELANWNTTHLPYFPNPVIQDARLATQLRQFHKTLEHSTSPLERQSQLLCAFAQMVMQYASDRPHLPAIGPEHQIVREVRDYLRSHYSDTITLEELAGIAGLKPLRLLRVFRKAVGLPPHAYLVQVRVAQAKQQLSDGIAIAQVAVDTGFTDQSHLNRHFKRLVGVTPKQYALGCKNIQDLRLRSF
jgi:AraC-like DNA-binding protein